MAFRTPTPLKSTDLQFGHCVENIWFQSLVPTRQFLPHCQCRVFGCLGMTAMRRGDYLHCYGPGPDGWLPGQP